MPPLFVIEFLHRVMDILEDYFGECNESIIKENYVIVYEVRLKLFINGNDSRGNILLTTHNSTNQAMLFTLVL